MKFIYFSLILMTSTICGYSQNCKIVKTEVDKFSKKEMKIATIDVGKVNPFAGGVKWRLEFIQENGKTTLKANIAMTGEFNQVFKDDTRFYFLLDNGDVITKNNSLDAKPITQVINGGNGVVNVFTTYLLTINLSNEDLEKLGKGAVTDVKVEVPDQKIKSPVISKKSGSLIRDAAICLVKTAN